LLAEYFLLQNCQNLGRSGLKISTEAEDKLLSHKWPGNVRELRNVMERAAILEQTDEVQPGNLPDFKLEARLRGATEFGDRGQINMDLGFTEAVEDFERKIVSAALKHNQYNVNQSAEQLKMTRHSLRYRMQQLGLTNNRSGGGE
jgi:DNA-binding NtrC family response regulator